MPMPYLSAKPSPGLAFPADAYVMHVEATAVRREIPCVSALARILIRPARLLLLDRGVTGYSQLTRSDRVRSIS